MGDNRLICHVEESHVIYLDNPLKEMEHNSLLFKRDFLPKSTVEKPDITLPQPGNQGQHQR